MNILVTTFGTSWQIIPELFGFTNPDDFSFFEKNKICKDTAKKYSIEKIDELWLLSPENNESAVQQVLDWAKAYPFKIKRIICEGVNEFKTEGEILAMRSCIYAAVAEASNITKEKNGFLYLSLTGGRKTMSADMQDAGYLFGCKAMIHIIDIFTKEDDTIRAKFKKDELKKIDGSYANYFLPVVINQNIQKNFILNESISYPKLKFENDVCKFDDKGYFALQIQELKNKSSNLSSNFSDSLINSNSLERSVFHKLYFLHPDVIARLKLRTIGKNKDEDLNLIKKLPKADLHSHLGGILSAEEIIETAVSENDKEFFDENFYKDVEFFVKAGKTDSLKQIKDDIFKLKGEDFKEFYKKLLTFIKAFKTNKDLFDEIVFGEYIESKNFYKIGLIEYQKIGDFQGSSLLQTKDTITKAVEIYIKKLSEDNIRYVEIRCSPYKYCNLGLTAEEVIEAVIKAIDEEIEKLPQEKKIEYRLIMIVGRDSDEAEIKKSIEQITALYNSNKEFSKRIAGVDLAGTEKANLPKNLREAFMPLLENCLSITIHAGETESVESIWQAVYHLSADRIGHGLKLLSKPELMDRFLYKNIGIEMCPSSNDQIVGFSRKGDTPYPLKKYMETGLKVTVNTDDCGISRTELSKEFYKAACLVKRGDNKFLTLWDCIVLIRNSLSIAFLDKKTKSNLMRLFEDEIFKLCTQGEII